MRTFALCSLFLLVAASARADITTGLMASYPFDGNLLDASGNGNNGTAVGGLLPTTDRFGTQDAAYEFNGTNSYIVVPNSATLQAPTTHLTQSAWVLFYGTSLVGQPFGPVAVKTTSTANAFQYRMIATPNVGVAAGFNNWNVTYGASYVFNLNQWYHIATVFDGTSVESYVDGVRVDSVAAGVVIASDTHDLAIGADTPGFLEVFYGKMDDVRFYNRSLTGDDIRELCECGPTGIAQTPRLRDFAINRTFPNPASGETRVEYSLGSAAQVELSVYDVRGCLVRGLRTGTLPAGDYSATWDGRNAAGAAVASGVYFVRLMVAGSAVSTRTVRVR